jgi:hypothetical protein
VIPTFRAVDRAPDVTGDTRVVVAEALVALRWWRNVPVRVRTALALTAMERFVLDVAATFGASAPTEFEEITNLPARLLPVLGRRLVAAGALTPHGTPANAALTHGMLAADELFTERTRTVDVVSLPATDELVILDPATTGRALRGWEKARVAPAGQYPVGTALAERTVADLLSAAGTVADPAGAGGGALAFPDGLCAVYRCSAQVVEGPGATVRLSIGGEAPGLTLTGVPRLVEGWAAADRVMTVRPQAVWQALLGDADGTGRHAVPRRSGPARWDLPVNGAQAARLAAARRNLAVPVGLAVTTADVVVEVAVRVTADDDQAAAAIDVDTAITEAVTAGSSLGALHHRLAADVAASRAVLDRTWQLGHYPLAYALREAEDFGYA